MKILLVTAGTAGDFYPFLDLAKKFKDQHQFDFCMGKSFQPSIEKNGFKFIDSKIDIEGLVQTEENPVVYESINLIKLTKYARRVLEPCFAKSIDVYNEVFPEYDLIIYHPLAIGVQDVCEVHNKKYFMYCPLPLIYPINEHPFFVVHNFNVNKYINKLTYKINHLSETWFIDSINRYRKNNGLSRRVPGSRFLKDHNKERHEIVYPISSNLLGIKSEYNNLHIIGFNHDNAYGELSKEASDFIEKHGDIICITFSSSPFEADHILGKINDLLVKHNRYVIFLKGNSQIYGNYSNILVRDREDHNSIFSKCSYIIHHGGMGTLSKVLYQRKPNSIMPFSFDQPFFAKVLTKSGLSDYKFNKDKFDYKKFESILTTRNYKTNLELLDRINGEDYHSQMEEILNDVSNSKD